MRKKFIAGNWKMYTTGAAAKALAEGVAKGVTDDAVTVAVFPPFPWLGVVGDAVKGSPVEVGAQNCHYAAEGAYTGEVAPSMLLDAGCKNVIDVRPPVASLATLILVDGGAELVGPVVRPEHILEHELGVGRIPEQEIGEPLLA